jgi:hypothetical protein
MLALENIKWNGMELVKLILNEKKAYNIYNKKKDN